MQVIHNCNVVTVIIDWPKSWAHKPAFAEPTIKTFVLADAWTELDIYRLEKSFMTKGHVAKLPLTQFARLRAEFRKARKLLALG